MLFAFSFLRGRGGHMLDAASSFRYDKDGYLVSFVDRVKLTD